MSWTPEEKEADMRETMNREERKQHGIQGKPSRAERRRQERAKTGVSAWDREHLEEQYLERDAQLRTCSDAYRKLREQYNELLKGARTVDIGYRYACGWLWLAESEQQFIESVLLRQAGPVSLEARRILRAALDARHGRQRQLNPDPKPAAVPDEVSSDAPVDAGGDGEEVANTVPAIASLEPVYEGEHDG